MEVVHKEWAARSDTQRILIVADGAALGRRQYRISVFGCLVQLSARTSEECLIVNWSFRGYH
jgi:hypothetical protein